LNCSGRHATRLPARQSSQIDSFSDVAPHQNARRVSFRGKIGHRLFFVVPLQINRGCVEMHARVLCFRIDAFGFQEDC
jgi:hypothetical protein